MLNKPKKDPTEASSYRPITLLSSLDKVFEKIILHYLKEELEEKKILDEHQYGFREGRSTESALDEMTKTINCFKKKYNHSILISFDVQGAFDRIEWSSLLKTLEKLGIEKNLVEIIQSYLLQRKVGH